MMVGEEGKTKIPILKNYTERGFDPKKHMLQSYGTAGSPQISLSRNGSCSARRAAFGTIGTSKQTSTASTPPRPALRFGLRRFRLRYGYYAGRKAAAAAKTLDTLPDYNEAEAAAERERLLAPIRREDGMDWRELNMAISKAMQNYCGGVKCDALLHEGLDLLESFETEIVPQISCKNPHELMRAHEVFDILTVSKLILHACLSRKTSSEPLFFKRTDSNETDPERDRRFITVRQENGEVIYGSIRSTISATSRPSTKSATGITSEPSRRGRIGNERVSKQNSHGRTRAVQHTPDSLR